jgi:hypothetical protein
VCIGGRSAKESAAVKQLFREAAEGACSKLATALGLTQFYLEILIAGYEWGGRHADAEPLGHGLAEF